MVFLKARYWRGGRGAILAGAILCVLGMWLSYASWRSSLDTVIDDPAWPRSFPFPDRTIILVYKVVAGPEIREDLVSRRMRPWWVLSRKRYMYKSTPAQDLLITRVIFGVTAGLVLGDGVLFVTRGIRRRRRETQEAVVAQDIGMGLRSAPDRVTEADKKA